MLRRHAHLLGLLGLTAIALVLRIPRLESVPNPAGDEGNWTWIAFDLVEHRPTGLPPDARFVSLAFAHLIGGAYHLLGYHFAAARAVCVTGLIAGMLLAYAACARMNARRAGLAIAAVMAVHPWSVLWSRTVTVPYALSYALAVAGPLWWLCALHEHRARPRALAMLFAAQLLFAGVHFSPLALCPLTLCALWTLASPSARRALRTPVPWVALVLGAAHTMPVFRGALEVAARGATRPNHQFDRMNLRVFTYGRTVLDGLTGEATLRHFTGRVLTPAVEILAIIAALSLIIALLPRTRPSVQTGTLPDSDVGPLRAFALAYLGCSLVLVPCLLAPARPWNLPAIDAERYLFAILAPFALCVGALSERPGRWPRFAVGAFALYLLLGPTARAGNYFLMGGGPDRGFWLLDGGGGYRGWKVDRDGVAIPWAIQREVQRIAQGVPATILVPDYAFHPLHFANARTRYPTVDVSGAEPPHEIGRRFFFALWSAGLLAPTFDQPDITRANDGLRTRMCTQFDALVPVRTFVQPDGEPLIELWTGVLRAGPPRPSNIPGCAREPALANPPHELW